MKQFLKNGVKLAAAAFVCALPFLATESQAVPAFARQTGMVCTTCHIGQDNVPNFTRTARIFQMRGYFTPTIRERIRGDGQTIEGEPQYGGDYLSLNMMDFFSARFVSELAQQSKVNGVKSDVTSTPAARMSAAKRGQSGLVSARFWLSDPPARWRPSTAALSGTGASSRRMPARARSS